MKLHLSLVFLSSYSYSGSLAKVGTPLDDPPCPCLASPCLITYSNMVLVTSATSWVLRKIWLKWWNWLHILEEISLPNPRVASHVYASWNKCCKRSHASLVLKFVALNLGVSWYRGRWSRENRVQKVYVLKLMFSVCALASSILPL